MSDDLRMRAARTWLISRGYIDEAAEQLAPELLAALDAVDPLRQVRGDAVDAALNCWFETECENWRDDDTAISLRQDMSRALNAALAVMGRSEAPDPSFPAWGPEMAGLVKAIAASWKDTHLSKQVDDLYNAAFPDPAGEGSP